MRRLCVTLLFAGLLTGVAAPASAADEIGLSLDGERWADRLTQPLFDQDTLWVPGDSRTVSFYVRNQAGSDASLTASVRSSDQDGLMKNDHIALRARAGGRWFALRNGKPSQQLTEAVITPGTPVKIEVEAAFDPNSSNRSQTESVRLMFEVRLTDAAGSDVPQDGENPVAGDGSDEESEGLAGFLPDTGSGIPVILMLMAGIATAVGATVVVAGRRERESDHV